MPAHKIAVIRAIDDDRILATAQTGEGGYEYTAYEIVVNGPEGEKKALKRYSEFEVRNSA